MKKAFFMFAVSFELKTEIGVECLPTIYSHPAFHNGRKEVNAINYLTIGRIFDKLQVAGRSLVKIIPSEWKRRYALRDRFSHCLHHGQ